MLLTSSLCLHGHWEGRFGSIKLYYPATFYWRACIPSQESDRSCICVLRGIDFAYSYDVDIGVVWLVLVYGV